MDNQTELRKIRMYRATVRQFLVAGAEREPMLMSIILSGALVFAGLTWLTTIVGLVFLISSHFFLRRMAANDPQLTRVFLDYLNNYKRVYYPAAAKITGVGHRSKT